jgi:hypothetical protein
MGAGAGAFITDVSHEPMPFARRSEKSPGEQPPKRKDKDKDKSTIKGTIKFKFKLKAASRQPFTPPRVMPLTKYFCRNG